MKDFIEQQIISAVRAVLVGRVNEVLRDMRFPAPPVEFGDYCGNYAVVPVIALTSCERTEKERIIRMNAYSLTITFTLTDTPDSEMFCYAYSNAVSKAIYENSTLSGIVDRAAITGAKFTSPKKANCGQEWELVINLRITIEGMRNEK